MESGTEGNLGILDLEIGVCEFVNSRLLYFVIIDVFDCGMLELLKFGLEACLNLWLLDFGNSGFWDVGVGCEF